jgi:hypothetical protein
MCLTCCSFRNMKLADKSKKSTHGNKMKIQNRLDGLFVTKPPVFSVKYGYALKSS